MKISEILWCAANEHLAPIKRRRFHHGFEMEHSCDAVYYTCQLRGAKRGALAFLESLGVETDSLFQFKEFRSGSERQGARYLWLDFARLVAEDEGI